MTLVHNGGRRPSRPWLRWAFFGAIASVLWFVWDRTPKQRTLHFDLGPDADLEELEFTCEGAQGTHLGARHRFPNGAPRRVTHEAAFVGDDLRCEVNLQDSANRLSTVRTVSLRSGQVTVLLQSEVQKLQKQTLEAQ